MKPVNCLLIYVAGVLLIPGVAATQNKVFRTISNDSVEKVLQGLELSRIDATDLAGRLGVKMGS